MTATSAELRYWVDMALECNRRDHTPHLSDGDQRGPFLSARALGLALAALNDAHAHALGSRPPLLASVSAPTGLAGAQPAVAAAAACHEVLVARFPRQSRFLLPAWNAWLQRYEHSPAGSVAEMAGRAFGNAVNALGKNDPLHGAINQYMPTSTDYTHQPPATQPGQGAAGAHWGRADRLMTLQVTNFPPPPGRTSATEVAPTQHFQDDFAKVHAKGAAGATGKERTLDEEVMGIYWGYDGPSELGTPPRLYLQVALRILDSLEAASLKGLTEEEELTIIAAIAVALADAGIDAWHYKYSPDHMMWRPAVGIPKAVAGNGAPDPTWLPLGRPDTNGMGLSQTPDFPAYPSGHATFGSAAFQLLRLFLVEKGLATFDKDGEDDIQFDFVSDEYNGRNVDPRTKEPRDHLTRGFGSLWQAIVENSVSRVYLGVHWQFDGITTKDTDGDKFGVPTTPAELGKTGGVWLGAKIANQIAAKIGVNKETIIISGM